MTTAHEVTATSPSPDAKKYWLSDWQLLDIPDPSVPPCGTFHTLYQYITVGHNTDGSWSVWPSTSWTELIWQPTDYPSSFASDFEECVENIGYVVSTDPASPAGSDAMPHLVGAVDTASELPAVGEPWGYYGVRDTEECWVYFTNYRGDVPGRWTHTDWSDVEPAYGPLSAVADI